MGTIKIGLAPNRAGFYDPHTGTGLNLAKPIATIYVDETKEQAGKYLTLIRSVYAVPPVLVLYEGDFPDSVKERFQQTKSKKKSKISFQPKVENSNMEVKSLEVKEEISEVKQEVLEKIEEVSGEEFIESAEKILQEYKETFEELAKEEKKEVRTYNKKKKYK